MNVINKKNSIAKKKIQRHVTYVTYVTYVTLALLLTGLTSFTYAADISSSAGPVQIQP